MILHRYVGLACLLVLTGCERNAPAPQATGNPPPSTADRPGGTNDVGDLKAPVAKLLGKPVTRGDCLSRSSGIGSVEVGIHRLVLGVLMQDFCAGEHLELTQGEIDAFWERLQSLQPKQDPPREPPSFDQLKIPAKLAETRAKLAAPDVGWLERLVLEGMERGQLYALEHESVPAAVAYSELMPLKCVKAVYEKYGGKVVARQISMEPAEAFLKLAQAAEQERKLEFLDDGLKQAFWKRMNDDLQHPAVAPESIDFSLPAIYQRPPGSTGTTTGTPNSGGPSMLQQFVGVWHTEVTGKPSKSLPKGGTWTVRENTVWILSDKFVLGREISRPRGVKSLWLMTYDPKSNSYPFWYFNSADVLGGKWNSIWDQSAGALIGKATDTPAGWTSRLTNQFPNPDTNIVTAWMKDDAGTMLFDTEAKKARQPEETGKDILAAWSESGETNAESAAERKILEQLIGTWESASVSKPAVWTPEEVRTKAEVTREWILDGQVVLNTTKLPNGEESLNLMAYDPQAMIYKNWWFNSDGNHNQSSGPWDAASKTFRFQSEMENGLTLRSSIRVLDEDQQEWKVSVTDKASKLYFDMEGTTTRRQAATSSTDVKRPAAKNSFDGLWGAVTYFENGQSGGDEPIAPEDSAIKFRFQGDKVMLLPSGLAGKPPQGTFQRGVSGKLQTIDFNFLADDGKSTGMAMRGIYEFDGDELKLCYDATGGKRPTDFTAATGSKRVMMVLKRIDE